MLKQDIYLIIEKEMKKIYDDDFVLSVLKVIPNEDEKINAMIEQYYKKKEMMKTNHMHTL